jgi:peptide/nickel transport system ATP-binding protein
MSGQSKLEAGPRLLTIEDLAVSFSTRRGQVEAVRGVSISVAKGEVLGIVGESGSGKSVTAYSVMRLLDRAGRITRGAIRFRGQDITKLGASDLRSLRGAAMSMIFQNPRSCLNPIRMVGDQIADALCAHREMTRPQARERALDLLKAVLIREPEKRLSAYPHELSGGMCQRVMMAMAMACEPDLLIADEPTTGLDVTTQKTVMDQLAALVAERGMAMILITHDLGLAAQYCDRVAVMEQGLVVETAAPAELFSAPRHAYTRRLVAASPTPTSTVESLSPEGLALSPAPSGERAEAGRLGPAEGEGRQLARNVTKQIDPLIAALTEQAAAPLPNPLPLQEQRKGRGNAPLMSIDNLVMRYDGNITAVDNISFEIGRGESLGLVGESGSGKSTISRIVCRLIDPTAGSIRFDGVEIGAISARGFHKAPQRADIQIVFQDPGDSLNPRFSAFDSVADPLRRLKGMRDGSALRTRVRDCATRCGLGADLIDRFPHQLSGGQRARVGIARAIAAEPKLLVLDEPTAALDVSVQAVILQLLDRLRREEGMAYLFVSHDLNVIRMMCERTIVLKEGKIVEQGQSAQLFTNPADAYTRALIAAIPHFEPGRAAKLIA